MIVLENTVTSDYLLTNLALVLYALASGAYLLVFQDERLKNRPSATDKTNRDGKNSTLGSRIAITLFISATLAIGAALVPVVNTSNFDRTTAVLLTLVIGILACVGQLVYRMFLIGALIAPLLTLILLIQAFLVPSAAGLGLDNETAWLISSHVVLAVVGQAFAILACVVSVIFLWQRRLLKRKIFEQIRPGGPAIDRIDRLLMASLWIGFVFLTLSLISGALYTQSHGARLDFSLEVKVVWAVVCWLWYLSTLLARNVFGRSGRRIAQMSVGGFVLLATTYFGMGLS